MLGGHGSVMPVQTESCVGEMYQIIVRTSGTAEENCGMTVGCVLEPTEIDDVGSLFLLHTQHFHMFISRLYVHFFPILQMQRLKSRKVTLPRFPLICHLPWLPFSLPP